MKNSILIFWKITLYIGVFATVTLLSCGTNAEKQVWDYSSVKVAMFTTNPVKSPSFWKSNVAFPTAMLQAVHWK